MPYLTGHCLFHFTVYCSFKDLLDEEFLGRNKILTTTMLVSMRIQSKYNANF